MVTDVEHTKVGKMKAIGVPVKLSDTPGAVRRAAPLLGEHTDDVINDWLGEKRQS